MSKTKPSCRSPGFPAGIPFGCLVSLALLTGCDDRIDPDALVEARLQSLSIVERAALLTAVPVRFDGGAGAVDSMVRLQNAPNGVARPGALWIEAATPEGLAAVRRGLPATWAPILTASLDQGAGSVVSGLTEFPPVSNLVRAGWDAKSLREAGRLIGSEALASGITLPIVNGPPILSGVDRLAVARDSAILAEGYQAIVEGALATGSSIGLHLYWSPDSLLAATSWDLNRFAAMEGAALDGGMRSRLAAVSLGDVGMPALDPDGESAFRSASVISGRIRRDAGFDGLVIADLLTQGDSAASIEDVLAAVAAGADLVVTRVEPAAAAAALVVAVTDGTIPQSRIDSAARKILGHMVRRDRAGNAHGASGGLVVQPDDPALLVQRAFRFLAGFQPTVEADSVAHLSIGSPGSPAPTVPDSVGMSTDRLAQVGRLMRSGLSDSVFTAGAVLVLRHGLTAYAEGFGETSDGSIVDVGTSLFDLASLTKVVGTTTAISILVDRGDLRLDDPVRTHLPEFRGEGKEDVTIRQLLAHTSGLPSGLWLYGSASSPEEALSMTMEQRLTRAPGTEALYSDLGFILLAEIVERLAGRSIDRFLTEQLFIPLGMSSTTYLPAWTLRGRIVPTADQNERPYPLTGVVHDANAFRLGGVAGHAGIFSTAADLARFAEMMLQSGETAGVRILSDTIVDVFHTRQPGAGERTLGWDTPADVSSAGRFASVRTFGHTGYTGTSLWIDPEYDLAIILLTNRTYPAASSREILELRTEVHDAIYQSITDRPVPRRAGAR